MSTVLLFACPKCKERKRMKIKWKAMRDWFLVAGVTVSLLLHAYVTYRLLGHEIACTPPEGFALTKEDEK